jgi:hypothetical protein
MGMPDLARPVQDRSFEIGIDLPVDRSGGPLAVRRSRLALHPHGVQIVASVSIPAGRAAALCGSGTASSWLGSCAQAASSKERLARNAKGRR